MLTSDEVKHIPPSIARRLRCSIPENSFAFDDIGRAKFLWEKARQVEHQYAIKLRKIARAISDLVRAVDPSNVHANQWLRQTLEKYADTIEPWARSVAKRMIAEVAARDLRAWNQNSRQIGDILAAQLDDNAAIGGVVRQRLEEQVGLIKSLPLEAAQMVHDITVQGLSTGMRASDIAKQIMEIGDVSKDRATLIARTEVARTHTAITQARAEAAGSTGYTWSTVRDSRVRPSHRAMEGRFVPWDRKPTLDKMVGHAGEFPNCRCICIPVFGR